MRSDTLLYFDSLISHVNCFGGSDGEINLNVLGGTFPYTYSWSNSATTSSINGLYSGTYSVIITDDNGCKDSMQVDILQPNSPLIVDASTTSPPCYG